jgi:hypothetical protein
MEFGIIYRVTCKQPFFEGNYKEEAKMGFYMIGVMFNSDDSF